MFSYSKVGIAILIVMILFSVMELVRLIKSFNKFKHVGIPVHFIGLCTGVIMSVLSYALLVDKDIFTKPIIYTGVGLSVLCFFVVGYNSMVIEREMKSKCKGGKRAYKKRKPPKSECL